MGLGRTPARAPERTPESGHTPTVEPSTPTSVPYGNSAAAEDVGTVARPPSTTSTLDLLAASDDETPLFTATDDDPILEEHLDDGDYAGAVAHIEATDDPVDIPVTFEAPSVWDTAGTEAPGPVAPPPAHGDSDASASMDSDSLSAEVEHDRGHHHETSGTADVLLDGSGGGLSTESTLHHGEHGDTGGTDPYAGTSETTVSAEGGVTARVHTPRHRDDGTWSVAWTLAGEAGLTGGGTMRPEGLPTGTGSLGVEAGGERSGTEIFETEEEAVAWRTRFLHEIAGMREPGDSPLLAAMSDGLSAAWWRTARAGTKRAFEVHGQASASLSTRIAGLLSLSAGVTFEATGTAEVERGAGETVEVELGWECDERTSLGASAAGLGVSGTLPGMSDHAWGVTTKYEVELGAGDAALERVLHGRASIPDDAPGTRLTEVSSEDSATDRASVSFTVGSLGGSDSVTRMEETRIGESGERETDVTSRGRHAFTGSLVGGTFANGTTDLLASHEDDRAWVAQSRVRASSGEESREMLAGAWGSGTSDAGSEGAESSGLWAVTQSWSTSDIEEFETALSRSRGSGMAEVPGLTHPISTLRSRLREIRRTRMSDDERRAARAEAMATFVSETGRDGLDLMESIAGTRPTAELTLYGEGGERDPNFMNGGERAALDGRIDGYQAEVDGGSPGADLADRIGVDLTAMHERLAAVSDEAQYTDLPRSIRAEVCARYNAAIGRLEALQAQVGLAGADAIGRSAAGEGWTTFRQAVDDVRSARYDALLARWHASWSREVLHHGWGGPGGAPNAFFLWEAATTGHNQEAMFNALWTQAEGRKTLAQDSLDHVEERLGGLASSATDGGGPDVTRLIEVSEPELAASRTGWTAARSDYITLEAAYHTLRGLESTYPDDLGPLFGGFADQPPSIGPQPMPPHTASPPGAAGAT